MARDTRKTVLVAAAMLLVGGAAAASAAEISVVGGTVGSSYMFDAANQRWGINSDLSGALAFDDAFNFAYTLGDYTTTANFNWWGSTLNQDLSSGGHARARFNSGGFLEVTGKLYDFFTGMEVYDGVLMRGTVAAFETYESYDLANSINTQDTTYFTPLSGVLVDGTFGLEMTRNYVLSFTGGNAQQNNGDLVDFQSDIQELVQFQWNMYPTDVPEPASLGLLVLGGAVVLRRRK